MNNRKNSKIGTKSKNTYNQKVPREFNTRKACKKTYLMSLCKWKAE